MEALSAPEITPGPTGPSMKPKKTIVKEKAQIPPSQIGIQRVRELLEEAKKQQAIKHTRCVRLYGAIRRVESSKR